MDFEKYYKSYKFNFTEKDIVKRNNNEYLAIDHDGLMFIRNFTSNHQQIDIDSYYDDNEVLNLNRNIIDNSKVLNSSLSLKQFERYQSAIIVGSHIKKNSYKLLEDKNSLIIGIDKAFYFLGDKLDIFIHGNPNECLDLYPNEMINKWPIGLFAYKTNPKFIRFWKGIKNGFLSPRVTNLLNIHSHQLILEDHRSIILSALNFISLCNIKNVKLIGVENYLSEPKDGTLCIKENVYMYPQQIINLSIMSAGIYWLKNFGVNVYIFNKDIDFIDYLHIIEE